MTNETPECTFICQFVNSWIVLLVYLTSDQPHNSIKCNPCPINEHAVEVEAPIDWVKVQAGDLTVVTWKDQRLDDKHNWNENWIELTLLNVVPICLDYVSPRSI
jgi:hypothetical protein